MYHMKNIDINHVYKRMLNNHLNCFALCFIGLVAYTLLYPARGYTLTDRSLFRLNSYLTIQRYIALIVIIGSMIYVQRIFILKLRYLSVLTLAFVVIIMLSTRNMAAGSGIVAANIILGYVALPVSFLLSLKVKLYRHLFPIMLLGVFLIYGVNMLIDSPIHPIRRPLGFFAHPNHLGNVLAFAVIFCYSMILKTKKPLTLVFLGLMTALLTFSLVHTISRGAWLGCVIGISASLLYLRKECSLKRKCLSCTLLVLVIIVGVTTASPERVTKRLSNHSGQMDISISNRLLLWRTTLHIIEDHWQSGIGIAQFGETQRKSYPVKFANNGRFGCPLNNYLHIAVEAGVPALKTFTF